MSESRSSTPAGRRSVEAVEPTDDLEVLAAGEEVVDCGVLACQADGSAHAHWIGGDVMTVDARGSGVRGTERCENTDEGGLSGAVRAEEASNLTGIDVETDAVDGGDLTELDDHIVDLHQWFSEWRVAANLSFLQKLVHGLGPFIVRVVVGDHRGRARWRRFRSRVAQGSSGGVGLARPFLDWRSTSRHEHRWGGSRYC